MRRLIGIEFDGADAQFVTLLGDVEMEHPPAERTFLQRRDAGTVTVLPFGALSGDTWARVMVTEYRSPVADSGEVTLVDHQDGGTAPLGVFGGERVGGLRSQGGVVGQGLSAEGGDDAVVDAAHPDGGIGQVDDGVAAAIQAGERGAHGDGLASADLAGDDADAAFGDAPADPGDRFVVGGVAVQHAGGQVAAEWRPEIGRAHV